MAKAKKDLGTKLSCQSCGAKFYDLKKKKKNPVCPKCDETYVAVKPKTRRVVVKAVVEPEAAAEAKAETSTTEIPANNDAPDEAEVDDDVEVEDDGNDDSLMEDTSDISGDEENMTGVIKNVGTADDVKDT